jgi:2-polyprenyl-6-hydroxyphenyl methylase/3-demethylubiquinone-9 3-methyltransferase
MAVQQRDVNEVKDYYERYWSADVRPHYDPGDVLSKLIEHNVEESSRCLDVGCGAGETYAQVIHARAASYKGVDVSARAVEIARSGGLDAQVIDDAAALPFDDNTFDVAVCIEVLEHLFSPHVAVNEIRRVLRPGGRLIVSAPNVAYWRLRVNLVLGVWNPLGDALAIEQPWRDPHIRFFTPVTLRRMLEQAGFPTVEVGAHGGCLLDHLTQRPTNFGVSDGYRRAEARFPSLLGMTVHAVAAK